MNNPRNWIIEKLKELEEKSPRPTAVFELVDTHGLRILRDSRPPALVFCAGVASGKRFNASDLQFALTSLPEAQFIVVVPTKIEHDVYAQADERGLCVEGFGELVSALTSEDDISHHQRREARYVRSRLARNRNVESVCRRGLSAWTVQREPHPDLTIVTSDEYEPTADEVYSLIEEYEDIAPSVIAFINPNARGISTDAQAAGKQVGVRLALMNDLLSSLDEQWN